MILSAEPSWCAGAKFGYKLLMAHLVVRHSNGNADEFPLNRLRTTIGRSARSDLCIPDAFASRLHAEIRQEGDSYWLVDLQSANGTRLQRTPASTTLPLYPGSEVQIGETRIVFENEVPLPKHISATLIADNTEALDPSTTISFMAR